MYCLKACHARSEGDRTNLVVVSEQSVDVLLKGYGGCAVYHIVHLASEPPPASSSQLHPLMHVCRHLPNFLGPPVARPQSEVCHTLPHDLQSIAPVWATDAAIWQEKVSRNNVDLGGSLRQDAAVLPVQVPHGSLQQPLQACLSCRTINPTCQSQVCDTLQVLPLPMMDVLSHVTQINFCRVIESDWASMLILLPPCRVGVHRGCYSPLRPRLLRMIT